MTEPMAVPPVRRSWWGRNAIWILPMGCLTPLCICSGLVTLVLMAAQAGMKSSPPYNVSLSLAQDDPDVRTELGVPIKAAYAVTGEWHVRNSDGDADADLFYGISGPKGGGKVHVVGTRTGGLWNYSTMDVHIQNTGRRINLLPGLRSSPGAVETAP